MAGFLANLLPVMTKLIEEWRVFLTFILLCHIVFVESALQSYVVGEGVGTSQLILLLCTVTPSMVNG